MEDLLSRLTLEEKVSLVHGNGHFSTAGVPRLGIPDLTMDDGPLGVREEVGEHGVILHHKDDFATAMPGTLGLAATWNPDLARDFGAVIGQEAKQRGKDIMLGPAVNIQRTPLCGRNFEYMGEDPFLTSRMAVNYIEGEQAQGFHPVSNISPRTIRNISAALSTKSSTSARCARFICRHLRLRCRRRG